MPKDDRQGARRVVGPPNGQSGFNSQNDAEFLAQAECIVAGMKGDTAFPEPWAAMGPTLAQIEADLAAYQVVLNETVAGNRTRLVQRGKQQQW